MTDTQHTPAIIASLHKLRSYTQALKSLRTEQELAALNAFGHGATWAQIGWSTGTTAQAAWEKWHLNAFRYAADPKPVTAEQVELAQAELQLEEGEGSAPGSEH